MISELHEPKIIDQAIAYLKGLPPDDGRSVVELSHRDGLLIPSSPVGPASSQNKP